jgi:hypothetical protein
MSASTQSGQTTGINPAPGNGHVRGKPGRKPAAKAAAPPLNQNAQAMTNPSQQPGLTNVAERRIGPAVTTTIQTAPPGTLTWLYARQQELEIEGRVIRQMIANFGPRRTATPGAPRKAKSKSKKKTPARQQAA